MLRVAPVSSVILHRVSAVLCLRLKSASESMELLSILGAQGFVLVTLLRGTVTVVHTDTHGSRTTGHDTQHRHYTVHTIFIS